MAHGPPGKVTLAKGVAAWVRSLAGPVSWLTFCCLVVVASIVFEGLIFLHALGLPCGGVAQGCVSKNVRK